MPEEKDVFFPGELLMTSITSVTLTSLPGSTLFNASKTSSLVRVSPVGTSS